MITDKRLKELADDKMICKVSWDERVSMAQELLALRMAFSQPVGIIEATYDYVTDVNWIHDVDNGEYLVLKKPPIPDEPC